MTLNLFIGSSIKAYKFPNNQFSLVSDMVDIPKNKVRPIKIFLFVKVCQIKVIRNLSSLKGAVEDFSRVSVCIDRNEDERKVIPSSIHFNAILDVSSLTYFKHTNIDEVNVLLSKMNKTTCMFDPFPTRLLLDFSHLFIDVVCIINLTFSTASFPVAFKSAVVKPLFKKPTLDCNILKNFHPVSNLPYLSKLIEKVIAIRLVEHMTQNTIMEKFQSAYKAHHSTETALL